MQTTKPELALAIALALSEAVRDVDLAIELADERVPRPRRRRLLDLRAALDAMRGSFSIALDPIALKLVAVGGPLDGRELRVEVSPEDLRTLHGEPVAFTSAAALGPMSAPLEMTTGPAAGHVYRVDLKSCRLRYERLEVKPEEVNDAPPIRLD